MQEILPDVFSWPWFSTPHGYNFNGHLIRTAEGAICIDPVDPDVATLDAIVRLGVQRIILTNRNHVRAANLVRTRTGARTAIHAADAAPARDRGAVLDDALQHGQQLGPLVVVGVPGKSAGEVALHWPERRLLIVGDAVIGNPPGRCALLPEKVIDDPQRLRAGVRGLLDLDFDTLLVGDGTSLLTGAHAALRDLIQTFDS